jgi:hypothetical protein
MKLGEKGESIMRTFLSMFFIMICILTVFCFVDAAHGEWEQCKVCHNGNTAPDAKALKAKYQTADEFIRGAKESRNPMMKNYKGNDELKEAANDLGLK